MRRDEFIRELEYLLQDIPDEDKADAIAYYRDYLEEAGPEKEEEVIRDFGSPERVAAIIRSDLNGSLEDGGEFTEKGYEDERFREPNFQLVKRRDLPEQVEEGSQGRQGDFGSGGGNGSGDFGKIGEQGNGDAGGSYKNRQGNGDAGGSYENRQGNYGSAAGTMPGGKANAGMQGNGAKNTKGKWEWWQIVGMIVLACCVIPVVLPLVLGITGGAIGLVFGLGGGVVGILALLAGLLLATTIALAAVTFALLLAGVLLVIFSFGQMSINLAQGVLCLGTGVGIFGLGLLGLSLCGLYYGKFIPWMVKSIIGAINHLLHRRRVSA